MDFVFVDSGMGGIPYMMRLREMDATCTCAYLADTAAFPYGEKPPAFIISRALCIADLAIKKWKPSCIVIACNTMSVASLLPLRTAHPDIPIVGTVPAIRLAAETTKNGRIGFLATEGTVASSYSKELTNSYASKSTVFPYADKDLVSFVERRIAIASEEEKDAAVQKSVQYFASRDCDVVVLGCTHFTHLADTFSRVASALRPGTRVVDSRDGVAKQALRVCDSRGSDRKHDGEVFTTGEGTSAWQTLCASLDLVWKGNI